MGLYAVDEAPVYTPPEVNRVRVQGYEQIISSEGSLCIKSTLLVVSSKEPLLPLGPAALPADAIEKMLGPLSQVPFTGSACR